MTRVSQFAQQQLTLRNTLNTQERVQEAQIQISTGKKSLNYAGIFQDASRLVSLEATQTRLSHFVQNNAIIESRLETMDGAMSSVFDSLSDLRKTLVQALNDTTANDVQVGQIAQNLLDAVTAQLNVKQNGRFLFAGSMTNTQPVTVPVPDPAVFGVPDASYYNGDSVALSARIDETTTITYGITADRQAFQEAIGAFKAAIQGANTSDQGLISTALGLTTTALDKIAGFRTEIGSDLQTLDRANQRNSDFLLFVEGAVSDIENVDVPATVAKLSTEQTILQASFLTLAQVTRLSLVDFLR
ncbi:MAG: flagellin [Alphaproteobacteria bacterium]